MICAKQFFGSRKMFLNNNKQQTTTNNNKQHFEQVNILCRLDAPSGRLSASSPYKHGP
jgi:hypothetical protein